MCPLSETPRPQRVTSLPSTPYDGQEVFYVVDATAGIVWHLRYDANVTGSYKWVPVGGGCFMHAQVDTDESTNNAGFVALSTAGPSITTPLAGDYEIEFGCDSYNTNSGQNNWMCPDVGGTAANATDAARGTSSGASHETNIQRFLTKTGLAAATGIVSKYGNVAAGTAHFRVRWLRIRALRVG